MKKFVCNKSLFLKRDVFLFPHEIWTLRGVVLLELILIMILTTVVALQRKKLSGMLLLDLNKRRAAKRKMKKATRNESTRL